MILRDKIDIYSFVVIKTSDGIKQKNYGLTMSNISCSFQPLSLNPTEARDFGLTDITSNAKRVFLRLSVSVDLGNRILKDGVFYDVRGTNEWPAHQEVFCVPVQGE